MVPERSEDWKVSDVGTLRGIRVTAINMRVRLSCTLFSNERLLSSLHLCLITWCVEVVLAVMTSRVGFVGCTPSVSLRALGMLSGQILTPSCGTVAAQH